MKTIEDFQEMLDDMDKNFLQSFKTDWLGLVTFYLISLFFQTVLGVAFYLEITTKQTPVTWQYFAIYIAVAYGFMTNLLKTIEMIVRDVRHHQYYQQVRERYVKRHPHNQAIIADEGGASGK